MTAKDLKAWVDTLDPRCIIEIDHYGWQEMEHVKIRAMYQSKPPAPIRTMDDVNNLEDVKS